MQAQPAVVPDCVSWEAGRRNADTAVCVQRAVAATRELAMCRTIAGGIAFPSQSSRHLGCCGGVLAGSGVLCSALGFGAAQTMHENAMPGSYVCASLVGLAIILDAHVSAFPAHRTVGLASGSPKGSPNRLGRGDRRHLCAWLTDAAPKRDRGDPFRWTAKAGRMLWSAHKRHVGLVRGRGVVRSLGRALVVGDNGLPASFRG